MKKIPAWPSLSIHENTLKICVSVKVLGVTIQIYLNWDCQVLSSRKQKALRWNLFEIKNWLSYRGYAACVRVCISCLAQFVDD